MKKRVFMMCCSMVLVMAGCGNNQTKENTSATIDMSESSTAESQENTEEKSENSVNVEIGKVRTALSDTGIEPLDLTGLPEGVAPEFTYFDYDTGFDGMVKAQQYLEQIGVSEEGKKLIVLSEQSNRSASIHIEEYTFTDDTIYHIQHTFYSYDGSFEEAVPDYGADSIDYMDEEAYYIRSAATEEPINLLRNYDNMADSLNDQYRKVIW